MNGHPPRSRSYPPGDGPAGIALIVTLFLLATITILVVGFTVSMRTERTASHSMWANEQTKIVADTALAHAVSLLSNNIPSPSAPGALPAAGSAVNWTINPGRLTLITGPSNVRTVDLHTGEATSNSDADSVNLNTKGPTTGQYAISHEGEPMRVKWQPVLADATQTPSKTNPITGRYAFWIDDESARINFNVAAGKPAATATSLLLSDPGNAATPYVTLSPRITKGAMTYLLGHPASVNLDLLGTINPQLYTDVYSKGFLRSPESIRPYATTASGTGDFYDTNRFFLTAFSRSPEFNVFGKSRVFPTNTLLRLSYGPYYQHQADDSQPMNFWSADYYSSSYAPPPRPTRLGSTNRVLLKPLLQTLAAYFQRSDWPGMPGQSFVDKWAAEPGSNPALALAEADQVALNLMARGAVAGYSNGSVGTTTTPSGTFLIGAVAGINNILTDNNAPGPDPTLPNPVPAVPDQNIWYGIYSHEPMLPELPTPRICTMTLVVTPESAGGASYYLKYHVRIGVYTPPDAPTFDAFGTTNNPQWLIRCAYLSYTASPATTTPATVSQTFQQSSPGTGWSGAPLVSIGWTPLNSTTMEPGKYLVLDGPDFYLGTNTNAGSDIVITSAAAVSKRAKFTGNASVELWTRMGGCTGRSNGNGSYTNRPSDLVPVYSPDVNPSNTYLYRPRNGPNGDGKQASTLHYTVAVPLAADGTSTGVQVTQSYAIPDPRLNGKSEYWTLIPSGDGLEWLTPSQRGADDSKYRTWDLRAPNTTENGPESDSRQFKAGYPVRSTAIGMFAFTSTGMQHGQAWQTFKLQPRGSVGTLPDWLLLDLIGPSFPVSAVTQGSPAVAEVNPVSYMNSTAGKININTKIYPANQYFAPAPRLLPLQALFQNMPHGAAAAQGIADYQQNSRFDYIGQVCQVSGVVDTNPNTPEYDREALIRHLAGCITTQSNTFGVYGVAQSVKKNPANTDFGNFQTRDTVLGEKRFYAVIERYVWPGRDGVPGNGHVNSSGTYDSLADTQALPGAPPALGYTYKLAAVDGPNTATFPVEAMAKYPTPDPNAASAPLDMADNPARALMKYRVLYFQYLTD